MTREGAIRATRTGGVTAYVLAAVTTAIIAVAILADITEGPLAPWNGAANLLDVILLLACGFGMLRQSRTAAVVAAVSYCIGQIFLGMEASAFVAARVFVTIVVLYVFIRAAIGAFAFHRIERAENPDYSSPSKWLLWLGIPAGLAFAAMLSIGFLSQIGIMPNTEVLRAEDIPASHHEQLFAEGIVPKGETIRYFYSEGFLSILEGGSVLTDQRVITYFQDETGQIVVYELLIAEVTAIDLVEPGSLFSDSVYRVSGDGGDKWLQFPLSTENGGDAAFAEALRSSLSDRPGVGDTEA